MPENSDRMPVPPAEQPLDAPQLPVSPTPYVTDEFAKPGALPAGNAEIVSVELTSVGPNAAASTTLDLADPQNQLAKNLADIDHLSEQLAELHSIIDKPDDSFDFDAALRRPSVPVDDATTELPPLREFVASGSAAPPPPTYVADQTPLAQRSAPKARKPRRKLVALVVAAVVIAIPTLSIAAVGPWLTGDSSNSADVVMGENDVDPQNQTPVSPPSTDPSAQPSSPTESPSASPGPASSKGTKHRPSSSPKPATNPKTGEVKPLSLTDVIVRGPNPPTAGKPVTFDVTWTDGSGLLSDVKLTGPAGSGISAQVPGNPATCTGEAPASAETTPIQYMFDKAGTYRLSFTVTTHTCDGQLQSATKELEVVVVPAPVPPATQAAPSPRPVSAPKA